MSKLTDNVAYPLASSLASTDLIYVVTDPGGTPTSKKATVQKILDLIGGGGGGGGVATSVASTASGSTDALSVKTTGDANPRLLVKNNGVMTYQSPNRAPYAGDHLVGAVGYGHDTQVYIERNQNVSTILTLQMNRPDSVPAIAPTITSGNSFPVSSGTVTVSDASDLPSSSAGPYALGTAQVLLPSFTDAFTRADSASTLGSPWSAVGSAVWGISSNKAYLVTADGTNPSMALYDTTLGTHLVQVTFSAGTGADGNLCGIVFNYIDNNNYILVRYNNSVAVWETYTKIAGVSTFRHNSGGPVGPNATVRAQLSAAGFLTVWYDGQPARLINIGTTLLAGTKCGLIGPTTSPGATARWDDFTVQTSSACTWTGKSGNNLTGFTCAGITGTATSSWKVQFTDGTSPNFVAVYDSLGAPVWNLRAYGGQHTTDNVTMGGGLGAEVGMMFLNDTLRTPSALVFPGDSPPTSSGWGTNRGTYIRRETANRIGVGGRLRIVPSDLASGSTPSAVASTASSPLLQLGTVDTGLYLKSTGPTDAIGIAVDGVEVASIDASGVRNASGTLYATAAPSTQPTLDVSGNLTLNSGHQGYLLRCTDTSGNQVITLPTGLSTGFYVDVVAWGGSNVQCDIGSGATVQPSLLRRLSGQYIRIRAEVVATNSWHLSSKSDLVIPTFDPLADISWHKAFWASDPSQTAPSNGAAVAAWRNAGSVSGDFAQVNGAKQPIFRSSITALNSKPGLEFSSAAAQLLSTGSFTPSLTNPYSVVAVVRTDAPGGVRSQFAGTNGMEAGIGPEPILYAYSGGAGLTVPGTAGWATSTSFYSTIITGSSTAGKVIGGSLSATGDIGTNGANMLTLGAYNDGSTTQTWDGWISFLALYNGDITTHPKWADLKAWITSFYGVTT